MSEKCFCHFNGYQVKDAKARDDTSRLDQELKLERERINQFVSLPNGATTGDAEIADARVGTDGTVYSNLGEAIRTQNAKRIQISAPIIGFGGIEDMSAAEYNTLYRIQATAKKIPAGLPSDYPTDASLHYFIKMKNVYNNTAEMDICYILDLNFDPKWIKENIQGTWGEWCETPMPPPRIAAPIIGFGGIEDMSAAEYNTLYRIQATANKIPAGLPSDYPTDASLHYFIKMKNVYNNTEEMAICYILDLNFDPKWVKENIRGTWTEWEKAGREISVTVGVGGDYTRLIDALEYAYSKKNVTVYVLPGVYDIVAEYGEGITNAGAGPKIGRGTRLVFYPGAKVVCEYNGGNSDVETNFSPINAGDGDFTIENMVIECKKVRYCVHDELGKSEVFGKHTYKNCDMKIDNNGSSWLSPQCIGGGLGKNTVIEIENCIFESARTDSSDYLTAVSYHNSAASGAKSSVTIKDCYIKGEGSVKIGYFGASNDITTVKISGCSLGAAPVLIPENNTAQIQNMNLVAWNNEIRS